MKVKKLIDELRKYNQDMEVGILLYNKHEGKNGRDVKDVLIAESGGNYKLIISAE